MLIYISLKRLTPFFRNTFHLFRKMLLKYFQIVSHENIKVCIFSLVSTYLKKGKGSCISVWGLNIPDNHNLKSPVCKIMTTPITFSHTCNLKTYFNQLWIWFFESLVQLLYFLFYLGNTTCHSFKWIKMLIKI